jgi:hypothetical protein
MQGVEMRHLRLKLFDFAYTFLKFSKKFKVCGYPHMLHVGTYTSHNQSLAVIGYVDIRRS